MLSNVYLEILWIFATCIIKNVISEEGLGNLVKRSDGKFNVDLSGCPVLEKQCSHLIDDFALLSCAINATHNNKSQVAFICQHKIWTYQAELLDNTYLDFKLRQPCQDEIIISDCLKPQEYGIDCVLKKKPTVRSKICWRMINKIESLIFNDWQITGNFLRNCFDDIQAYNCGRIPPDAKSLSQTHTLKCLQDKEQDLKPDCQSEMTALKEMKYNMLQLDKIVFVACNLDQKTVCPDELPGSWMMYKCLVDHKYENGNVLFFHLYYLFLK